jgi:dsRNA-specific ribonuclease
MDNERIEKEMHELEILLHYPFRNIRNLAKAMGSIKLEIPGQGKNGSEYSNEGLATVGDTILKFVLADKLYREGITAKGQITSKKSSIEKNSVMHRMMLSEGLLNYAYNDDHFYKDSDTPDHEKVVCKEHDPYIEAIVGAVYYDSNYETTKRWILEWLLPLLEKYS